MFESPNSGPILTLLQAHKKRPKVRPRSQPKFSPNQAGRPSAPTAGPLAGLLLLQPHGPSTRSPPSRLNNIYTPRPASLASSTPISLSHKLVLFLLHACVHVHHPAPMRACITLGQHLYPMPCQPMRRAPTPATTAKEHTIGDQHAFTRLSTPMHPYSSS